MNVHLRFNKNRFRVNTTDVFSQKVGVKTVSFTYCANLLETDILHVFLQIYAFLEREHFIAHYC